MVPLRQLAGYRIADGAPDVRGWSVIAGDGSTVGEVADLVVDTAAETIRYLVVSDGQEAAVLIPIGYSRVDKAGRRVELPVLAPEDLHALRVYQPGEAISRAVENTVRLAIEELLSGSRRFDRADFADDRRG